MAKLASKMVESGGAKTVDDMIQAMPDGNDTKMLNALATGRYGTKFKSNDSTLAGADQAKAMKSLCKMFAEIPQDIRNNRSIKGVTHSDASGSAGGAHNFDSGAVTMNGRPEEIDQEFGAGQDAYDPKTNTRVKQLPAVEDAAQPVNDDALDYLGFAAAHEVGARRRRRDRVHGAPRPREARRLDHLRQQRAAGGRRSRRRCALLGLLQDARAAAVRARQAAEQAGRGAGRGLRLARRGGQAGLRRLDTTWPRPRTSIAARATATPSRSATDIYQEAYPRTWVSYLADARKQGLTGYQFRAPASGSPSCTPATGRGSSRTTIRRWIA